LFLPDGGGLGVLIPAGQNAHVLVQNSIFESNRATPVRLTGYGNVGGYGGGINTFNAGCQMGSCPLKVVNSVFTHNRAIAGGGISVGGGAAIVGGGAELVNVTATRNGGGGVFIDGATDSGTVSQHRPVGEPRASPPGSPSV